MADPNAGIVEALAGSGVGTNALPPTDIEKAMLTSKILESQGTPDILDQAMGVDAPVNVPQTPPPQAQQYQQQQYQQQAPPQQQYQQHHDPNSELMSMLTQERAARQEAERRAALADAYEAEFTRNPQLAQQFLASLGEGEAPPQVSPDGTPQQQQGNRQDPRVVKALRQLEQRQAQVEATAQEMRLKQEHWELQQTVGRAGMYNPQATWQYMQSQGFRSLKDAYNHMMGNALSQYVVANAATQAYGYQPPATQGYNPQYQGGYQQSPQQYQQQQGYPQQWQQPASPIAPPPAHDAQVMRPGTMDGGGNATAQQIQAVRDFRPKNEQQLRAKMGAYHKLGLVGA